MCANSSDGEACRETSTKPTLGEKTWKRASWKIMSWLHIRGREKRIFPHFNVIIGFNSSKWLIVINQLMAQKKVQILCKLVFRIIAELQSNDMYVVIII